MRLTHWEYVFNLHTRNLGDEIREDENPFTGEPTQFHVDLGLTPDEIAAIKVAFDRHEVAFDRREFEGLAPFSEGYVAYGAGGDSLRFRCADLDEIHSFPITGMSVDIVVRQLLDEYLEIVLDVASSGNLLLMDGYSDPVLTIDEEPSAKILARWPYSRSIRTIDELRSWIENEVGGRRVYTPSI